MRSLHSLTWLAVQGKAPAAICNDLELRTGMAVSKAGRFPIEGAMSDAGWYVIVADGFDHRLIQPAVLTRLSAWCQVLTCTTDDRNLASTATAWREGRRLWSLTYRGEDHPGEVVVEGELPASLVAIQEDLTKKAAAEDAGDLLLDPLFEIAIEIVHTAAGYRPDQRNPAFDGRWTLLEAIHPTFKQRLFGG